MTKEAKRPRTLGRYSKEMHEEAKLRQFALVHVEINDAYLMDADGSNWSIHGPASPQYAAAIRDVMLAHSRGEFRDVKDSSDATRVPTKRPKEQHER